jgi:hypothetical protein
MSYCFKTLIEIVGIPDKNVRRIYPYKKNIMKVDPIKIFIYLQD